ncbi:MULTISPECIES: hypothetical protein [Olivibacter]|uniref:Major capsid protein E n=1 Tax=Olivibacter jilunii TaxID=985016 RepID=A0ABW6AWC3_9SPHI
MTVNIDELIAEFGAHYRDGGQGMKDLQVKLRHRSVTPSLFAYQPTSDTILYKATTSIKRVIQSFQKQFTPISGGELKFELESIPLNHIKIDESIWPDDVAPSWAGFLAGIDELDRSKWPLCRWLIEQHILPQADEDLELLEYFKGEAVIPTEGTAGAAGKSLNGVRIKIRNGYAAGKTQAITMGAMPTDPVLLVEYVEDFINQVPTLVRRNIKTISLSETKELAFRIGMDTKYNDKYDRKPNLSTLKYHPITVVGVPSQEGSDLLYVSPEFNKVHAKRGAGNKGKFDIQKDGRNVKLLSDWWEGLGFWYLPYVYHNDQDLVATP